MVYYSQQKYNHKVWTKELSWPKDLLLRLLSQEEVPSAAELNSLVLAAWLRVVNAYYYEQGEENSLILSKFSFLPLEQF